MKSPHYPPNYPKRLSFHDSSSMRQAYLQAFVDINKDYYQQHISTPHQYSDGLHYDGYLWDCLRIRTRITYQFLCLKVVEFPNIFVMADDHSHDRVHAPLWPYPPYSVVSFKPQIFLNALPVLPQDMYIFDSSISWTLVLTHEYDDKRRYCWTIGIAT
jgi:hypothetical protein